MKTIKLDELNGITIPEEMRKCLGIKNGDFIEFFEKENDCLVMCLRKSNK